MACVFVYPFLVRPLLSVSPQPGTSWLGKATGKGSTVPTFKEPQTTRGPHLGSEWDVLPSCWCQLWSRAPGSCRTSCWWAGVEGAGPCTHGASCFQGRALVYLKVFSGYSSPFLCVSFSAFFTSLPPLSFLPSQSKLGSEGPHTDPMDSPSLKSGGPTFNRTLTPRKAGMGKEQGTCVTVPNQRPIPPTPPPLSTAMDRTEREGSRTSHLAPPLRWPRGQTAPAGAGLALPGDPAGAGTLQWAKMGSYSWRPSGNTLSDRNKSIPCGPFGRHTTGSVPPLLRVEPHLTGPSSQRQAEESQKGSQHAWWSPWLDLSLPPQAPSRQPPLP